MSNNWSTFYIIGDNDGEHEQIAKVTHDTDVADSQDAALRIWAAAAEAWIKVNKPDEKEPFLWLWAIVNAPLINPLCPSVQVQYIADWEHIYLLNAEQDIEEDLE